MKRSKRLAFATASADNHSYIESSGEIDAYLWEVNYLKSRLSLEVGLDKNKGDPAGRPYVSRIWGWGLACVWFMVLDLFNALWGRPCRITGIIP